MIDVKVADVDDLFDIAELLTEYMTQALYVVSREALLDCICKEDDEGHQVFIATEGSKRIGTVKGYKNADDYFLKNRVIFNGIPKETLDPHFIQAAVQYARQEGLSRVCLEWEGSCVDTLCNSGFGQVIGDRVAIPVAVYRA